MSDHLKDIPDASLKGGSKKSSKKDPPRKLIAREAGPETQISNTQRGLAFFYEDPRVGEVQLSFVRDQVGGAA